MTMTMNRCQLALLVIATLMLQGLTEVSATIGHIAPLVPSSYRTNALQNKFNHNGATCPPASPSPGNVPCVNHTMSQTTYSSYEMNILRTDTAAFENNLPNLYSPANLVMSTIDFSKKPELNTFVELPNMREITCQVFNASWLPPLPNDFLRTLGAIYGGKEFTSWAGMCSRWNLIGPNIALTFLFDEFETPTGWYFTSMDKAGGQQQVGVTTQFHNYQSGALNPSIFAGSGSCSAFNEHAVHSIHASDAKLLRRQLIEFPRSYLDLVLAPQSVHINQVLALMLTPHQIAQIYFHQ